MEKFAWGEMTWPEINQASKEGRVAILPVATIEDHGPHLPVDTDVLITNEICLHTGKKIPKEVVVIPPVIHGYSPHHMDFPGCITIGGKTFIDYVLDITKSIAHHGFRKILIVNGHGSNVPFMDIVSRLTIIERPNVQCAMISWWSLGPVVEAIKKHRESEFPGGMTHACELETSLYLALKPELVDMSRAVKDISFPKSEYFWFDLASGGRTTHPPATMMEYWSTLSKTGVIGDPTKATVEKGNAFLKAAVKGLIELVRDLKARGIRERVDHHS